MVEAAGVEQPSGYKSMQVIGFWLSLIVKIATLDPTQVLTRYSFWTAETPPPPTPQRRPRFAAFFRLHEPIIA
jgi:hypothetical protein